MTTVAAVRGLDQTSELFRWKLVKVAETLGANPDHLAAAISFESAFDPARRNPFSGAVGLIQFTDTALAAMARRGYAVTRAELGAMTREEQLDWVQAYLQPFQGRMKNLADVYLAVFAPAFIGRSPESGIYQAPSQAYEQNKALDRDNKGVITVADATRLVGQIYADAMSRPRLEVPIDAPLADCPGA